MLKNPLTIWLKRWIKARYLEKKHRSKFLRVGYMSILNNSQFGLYNTIYENVSLNEVSLGDFTYISNNTKISKTKIGKFCSIGPDCKIGLGRHPSKDFVSTHPMFFSPMKQAQITFADKSYFEEYQDIEIGNDVWVGANVIVLDGVHIADGAIVAAGSVVNKDVPPYAIVAGVPAKVIKYRFEDDEIKKLLHYRWWDKSIEELKSNFRKLHNVKDML